MSPDYRDIVIEELAASEATLNAHMWTLAERAINAEADRDALQLVATRSFHYAHEQQRVIRRQQEQLDRLGAECRELRAALMKGDQRAA